MNNKINQMIIDTAIENCTNIEYPVIVSGSEFGDDLANALNVIKELSNEVERLKSILNKVEKL